MQAITRNANLICGTWAATSAGPGTEQMLWEIAATGTDTAVGGHIIYGPRKSVLVKPNQGTGLEGKWEAEVARAGASLSREEANELIDFIMRKYEDNIAPDKAPPGYSFRELYDYDSVTVKPEYYDLYCKVKRELEEKGLKFD